MSDGEHGREQAKRPRGPLWWRGVHVIALGLVVAALLGRWIGSCS